MRIYHYTSIQTSVSNGRMIRSIMNPNGMLYFIEKCHGVFFTKMNKLLFYSDFQVYRQTGKGITGLAYKAIDYGPVPVRWDRIYSFYDNIHPEIKEL